MSDKTNLLADTQAENALLRRALKDWLRAFETGRNEPLYAARDETLRTFPDLSEKGHTDG